MHTHASVTRRQQTFGYTEEELRVILAPMAKTGGEPLGSMGTDSPIAALSERPRLLFDYFTQLFAQVTNPPLDAIREELVTSLHSSLGPQGNLLEPTAASCRSVTLPFPVIDNDELAKLIHINADGDMPGLKAATLSGLYRVSGGGDALAARIEEICAEADAAIDERRPPDRPVRPPLGRRARADPVAAAHLGRPPPPHPHQAAHPGGPAGRGRRRPRGPPRRPAHRLRRRRRQPVPGDGVRRGPRPRRHVPLRTSRPSRPSAT